MRTPPITEVRPTSAMFAYIAGARCKSATNPSDWMSHPPSGSVTKVVARSPMVTLIE